MEKKKSSISSIIYLLLIIIVSSLTVYKIIKNHQEKLYNVLYSEIEYKARKCYLDKMCEKTITLPELYDKNYLEIIYDPISKEEIKRDLKISIEDNKVIIEK